MTLHSRTLAVSLLLAFSPLAFATALAAQDAQIAQAPAQGPVWAFETSDVPVDPDYTFGQLDNGMRYIIRRNATPQGTALVRLRIDSGTLEERDDERGLAHYLEHIAFNGSAKIPEGEMIKLLEREGLAFGADTNAATNFTSITYMLNLPRNDAALLDTALMLMRETASELTIAPDAVERERGVILAEWRDRAGFQLRNFEDNVAFIAPNARYGSRLPVGIPAVIENATAEQNRSGLTATSPCLRFCLQSHRRICIRPRSIISTRMARWLSPWCLKRRARKTKGPTGHFLPAPNNESAP